MPARGELAAPIFDRSKPRELLRYFSDLEYLFDSIPITNEVQKKKHTVRYADFDTEQAWRILPEFSDPTVTYSDYKQAILFYYPDATEDFTFSLQSLDILIRKHQETGIFTARDASDYHLQFLAITTSLIERGHLDQLEQQRAYTSAFRPQSLLAILDRLQIKDPDHHPNIPHAIQDVYEAARFILHQSTIFPMPQLQLSLPASVPAITAIQRAPVASTPVIQSQVKETISIATDKDTALEIAPEQFFGNKFIGYAPPSETNFGALIKSATVTKRPDLTYSRLPRFKALEIAARVNQRIIDAPITISQQQLLSLAPDISSQAQEISIPRRIVHKGSSPAQNILRFVDSSSTNIPITSVFAIATSNQPTRDLIILDSDGPYHQSLKPVEDSYHSYQLVAQELVTERSNLAPIFNNQSTEGRPLAIAITAHSVEIDRTASPSTDIRRLQPQDASHDEELAFPKLIRFLDTPGQSSTQLLLNSHFGNRTQSFNLGSTQKHSPIDSEASPCVSKASSCENPKNSPVDEPIASTEIKSLQNNLPSLARPQNNIQHAPTLMQSPTNSFTVPNCGSDRNPGINTFIVAISLFQSILIQIVAKLVAIGHHAFISILYTPSPCVASKYCPAISSSSLQAAYLIRSIKDKPGAL